MLYNELARDIERYIMTELEESLYYESLAQNAPSSISKELLLKVSHDEKRHAENFKKAYYYLTGKDFVPREAKPQEIPFFWDGLKARILSETEDYKNYSEQYLYAPNKYLKDLFFMTRTTEAQHAMRIPLLFEEWDELMWP